MGQHLRQVTAGHARRVEVIERTGDQQIGVGIEIAREFFALITQIRLDFKLDIKRMISQDDDEDDDDLKYKATAASEYFVWNASFLQKS